MWLANSANYFSNSESTYRKQFTHRGRNQLDRPQTLFYTAVNVFLQVGKMCLTVRVDSEYCEYIPRLKICAKRLGSVSEQTGRKEL